MMDVVFVKWGGSLLTDKTRAETLRPEVLDRLAGELARGRPGLAEAGIGVVLGHGSGSFGHVAADRWKIHQGLQGSENLPGVAETQAAAAVLHDHVLKALGRADVPAFSIAPSSAMVAASGRPVEIQAEPVALALRAGLVPVVYGDVVLDRDQGATICSTETVFSALAEALPRHDLSLLRCLWLGETDGVWDDQGETIPEIDPADGEAQLDAVGGSRGTDVTGGMLHRLEHVLDFARSGVPSWIGSGLIPGRFERALGGREATGTRVKPRSTI